MTRRSVGLAVGTSLVCVTLASASAQGATTAGLSHVDPHSLDRVSELRAPPLGIGGALSGAARLHASAEDVRLALPGFWCGAKRGTDDHEHEAANGTYKFHAIYAMTADAADQFATFAGTIQADVFQASALLERLYGRAIRFDLGTSCGPGYLDITTVRLPDRGEALRYLANDAGKLIDRIAEGLRAKGFPVHGLSASTSELQAMQKSYVVWLDGMTAVGGVCGLGGQFGDERRTQDNLNNFGGQLAVVLRSGAGFCNSNTVRHEVGHTLGALRSSAPNAFDGAHCDDAYEDTMCYPLAPSVGGDHYQGQFFDYRNDDYWDPAGRALPGWTVNLSRFICPDVSCNVASTEPPTLLDAVDLLLRGLFVSCPGGGAFNGKTCAANTTADTSDEVAVARMPLKVVLFANRARGGRWKITLKLTGIGTARVRVTCRRDGRSVRVLSKRLRAPRTYRTTVRCDTRPRARATAAG